MLWLAQGYNKGAKCDFSIGSQSVLNLEQVLTPKCKIMHMRTIAFDRLLGLLYIQQVLPEIYFL